MNMKRRKTMSEKKLAEQIADVAFGTSYKTLPAPAYMTDQHPRSFSRVFDQAENRMHTIKAVMVATLT
jgi:hypothetical protein